MKHKHAKLIHAWADGAEIETKMSDSQWVHCNMPVWYTHEEYRIMPKPDVVAFAKVYDFENFIAYISLAHPKQDERDNLKLTWDGETGCLKSAEVV